MKNTTSFFANIGKNTFKKSQQHINNGNIRPQVDEVNITNTNGMFRPTPIDNDTIILTIIHMKNTHSYGSDGIPLRFIRDSLPIIITFITCIFNTPIVTGVTPVAWKHSIVIPTNI